MGRPPKYKTPEELQTAITEYFESCDIGQETVLVNNKGVPVLSSKKELIYWQEPKPYQIAGMKVFIGLTGNSALKRYEERGDLFREVITRAKGTVEANLNERGLLGKNDSHMTRLNLSNFGYGDKQQLEITGPNGIPLTLFPEKGEYTMTEWTKQTNELKQAEKAKALPTVVSGDKVGTGDKKGE
jgi:hypothetical protein